MTVPQTEPHDKHRVRRPGMSRGWRARQMSPEALAKDIAESIMLDSVYGQPVRTPDAFTTCPETVALVAALLAAA